MANPKVNYLPVINLLADQTDEFDTAISLKAIDCVATGREFVTAVPRLPGVPFSWVRF